MPNQQTTDSASGDACQLKAGHPPAIKVGNMRVVQRTHSTSSTHSDKSDEEKNATGGKGNANVPQACSFAPKTVVKTATSGVPDTVVQSVPEAVKQFHEKPQVTREFHSHSNKPNVHIQQPKK